MSSHLGDMNRNVDMYKQTCPNFPPRVLVLISSQLTDTQSTSKRRPINGFWWWRCFWSWTWVHIRHHHSEPKETSYRFLRRQRWSLTITDALASKPRPGPATSTPTMSTNPMTSVLAGSATASTQVIKPLVLLWVFNLTHCINRAHSSLLIRLHNGNLKSLLRFPTLMIDDIASVAHITPPSVAYSYVFQFFTDDK